MVKFNSRMTRLEDEIETARQLIGEETKLFGDQPEADQEAEVVEEADDDRGDEDDDGGSRSEGFRSFSFRFLDEISISLKL